MTKRGGSFVLGIQELVIFVRAAVAAVLSVLAAHFLRLPEFYWAPISALVVLLSATNPLDSAWQRFAGTAVGAALGALIASFGHPNWLIYGVAVLVCGLACAMLRLQASYRIAAITLTIILLIPHGGSQWVIALHRFVEVSLGIAVALALAFVFRLPQSAKI
jgi:uncharacterized membrane protein YccC